MVLISSCCVVRCSSSRPSSVLPSVLLIMSNVCVSVNYAIAFSMGVLDDFFWTKQLYFAVGIIYWASISLWNLRRSPVPSTPPSHPPWCWWVIVVVHNNMNTTTNLSNFPLFPICFIFKNRNSYQIYVPTHRTLRYPSHHPIHQVQYFHLPFFLWKF